MSSCCASSLDEGRTHTAFRHADVKTVLAIALSEYKIGDAERGRTIFEGLVDSHPKRLDIWLVYIAQEAKSDGNAAVVR